MYTNQAGLNISNSAVDAFEKSTVLHCLRLNRNREISTIVVKYVIWEYYIEYNSQ